MKAFLAFTACAAINFFWSQAFAQPANIKTAITTETNTLAKTAAARHLYIDVHHVGAGKVDSKAVAAAHQKDLAVEKKYGVDFIKYWLDEAKGDIYCLSTSPNAEAIRETHAEAHGLLPDSTYEVTEGTEASSEKGKNFFLDVHEFGPGNVSAAAVAGAHQKDLAVQKKYNVNFINYWVNEKDGIVMCLAQAPDSAAMVNTHKEAHGLIPVRVAKVQQGR